MPFFRKIKKKLKNIDRVAIVNMTRSASTFIKLDFLFSSLFIAIFPARNGKISWQISWHLLYLYLAFRSFPTEYWFHFCTIS